MQERRLLQICARENFATELYNIEFWPESCRENFSREKCYLPESCAKEFFLLESLTRESYDFVSMILTCHSMIFMICIIL